MMTSWEFDCPLCGRVIWRDDEHFGSDDDLITCPDCGSILRMDCKLTWDVVVEIEEEKHNHCEEATE